MLETQSAQRLGTWLYAAGPQQEAAVYTPPTIGIGGASLHYAGYKCYPGKTGTTAIPNERTSS